VVRTFGLILAALAGAIVLSGDADRSTRAPGTLRALTYNSRVGAGGVIKADLTAIPQNLFRISEFLKSADVDIILLQEVDQLTERSGQRDEAAILARALGFHQAFAPAVDLPRGRYGVAVLSRFPILGSRAIPLPVTPGEEFRSEKYLEPRVLQRVDLDAEGQRFCVFNTHLGLSADQRREQWALIRAELERAQGSCQILLGGDFNLDSPDELPAELRGWSGSDSNVPTYPIWRPEKKLDAILAPAVGTPHREWVIPVRYSDHFPVLVELKN